MSEIAFANQSVADVDADVVAVFAAKGEERTAHPGADAVAAAAVLEIDLPETLAGVRFEGDLGSVARIPTRGKARASLLLVIGLGPAEKITVETLRRGAGAATRSASAGGRLSAGGVLTRSRVNVTPRTTITPRSMPA